MRRNYVPSLIWFVVIIVLLIAVKADHQNKSHRENKEYAEYKSVTMPVIIFTPIDFSKYTLTAPVKVSEEVSTVKVDENKRPQLDSVPLPDDLLDYIWERSNKLNLPYTMVVSVAKAESDFNINLINRNNNGTVDRGLFQINSGSLNWLASKAQIANINPFNPYQSTDMAIAYLKEERDYWGERGYQGEQLHRAMLLSYNRGRGGATYWLNNHGWSNKYVNQVLEFEQQLDEKS